MYEMKILKAKVTLLKLKNRRLKKRIMALVRDLADQESCFETSAKQRDEIATNLHNAGIEIVRLKMDIDELQKKQHL